MIKTLSTSFFLGIFMIASFARAQGTGNYLLALSKSDHTLAIVDAKTLKVLGRVPVGSDPHEVVASADGTTAYVSNAGGGSLHEMNVIDLVNMKALPNVDTKALIGLHGLMFEGGKVWFTAEGAKAVGRYDPVASQVDWIMGTGQDRTHMIFVTTDQKRIYTTNVSSGSVSILMDTLLTPPPNAPAFMKPRHEWMQTIVPVSRGAEGFDVTPDGKQLWTAASEDGVVWIIDLATKKVVHKIDAKVQGANRLKFTPDGKLALVSTLRSGELTIIDVQSRKEVKRLNMGRGGAGILVDPDGSRAFVGCTPDNQVTIIDLKKLEISGHLDVGGGPDGLAWATRK